MPVAPKCVRLTRTAFLMVACGLAVSARADLPPAMDRTPADALGVMAVRNLAAFHDRVSQYAEMFAIEIEGSPLEKFEQLLSTPGMQKDGSAMIVLLAPAEGSEEPRAVVVAPVSDARAFAGALNAEGEGVMTAQLEGETVHMKDAGGGYIAMSPDKELLSGFTLGQNAQAALKTAMGPTAAKASDRADLVMYFTPAMVESGFTQSREQIEEQAEMMAEMGGPQAAPAVALKNAVGMMDEHFKADGQAMVMTLGVEDLGVVFDIVGQFKENSPTAQHLQLEGKSGSLSKMLPDGNFLFAGSVDMSSPMVKSWMREAQAGQAAGENLPFKAMMGSLDKMDGVSMAIGLPPAGLMGGLMTACSGVIKTEDPKGMLNAYKATFEELNGTEVAASKIQATYKSEAVDVGGSKVDSWQIILPMNPDDPNAMQMQQMQMMLFGMAPGPSGLMAAVPEGIVWTMGNNSLLMNAAMESAKSGKGLAAQELFGAVHERLPDDRLFEGYLGVKGLIDMVGPFIAMQTGGAPMTTPDKLSPIGFAGTMNDGAFGMRIVVPRDVLETISDIMADMQAEEEMPADEDAPEGENRPPRF